MDEEQEIDYKVLLMQLLASLTLCDHMGDVGDDVDYVLKKMGHTFEWSEWNELSNYFGSIGIDTVYGTSLSDE